MPPGPEEDPYAEFEAAPATSEADPYAEFEAPEESGTVDLSQPAAEQGLSLEGAQRAGLGGRRVHSRVLALPETDITVDPRGAVDATGHLPTTVRTRGEFTEFRDVSAPATGSASAAPTNLMARLSRWASGADPTAMNAPITSSLPRA